MNEQLLKAAEILGRSFGRTYPHFREDMLSEAYLAACEPNACYSSIRGKLIKYAREQTHIIRIPAQSQRDGKQLPAQEDVDPGYDPGEIEMFLIKSSFKFDEDDEPVIRKLVDGFSIKEIAEEQQVPIPTVYAVVQRFRDRNGHLRS